VKLFHSIFKFVKRASGYSNPFNRLVDCPGFPGRKKPVGFGHFLQDRRHGRLMHNVIGSALHNISPLSFLPDKVTEHKSECRASIFIAPPSAPSGHLYVHDGYLNMMRA
jgi:hypothetical protein